MSVSDSWIHFEYCNGRFSFTLNVSTHLWTFSLVFFWWNCKFAKRLVKKLPKCNHWIFVKIYWESVILSKSYGCQVAHISIGSYTIMGEVWPPSHTLNTFGKLDVAIYIYSIVLKVLYICICLWAMGVLRRGWGEVEGWLWLVAISLFFNFKLYIYKYKYI